MDREGMIAHLTLHGWEPRGARLGVAALRNRTWLWANELGELKTLVMYSMPSTPSDWDNAVGTQIATYYRYAVDHHD